MELLGLVDIPMWILLSLATFITWYIWVTWTHGYFKSQGIPGPKPYPIVGTIVGDMYHGIAEREMDLLKYGKTVGLFQGSKPTLWTCDENILREVFVKDFSNFTDRTAGRHTDKIMSNMILIVPGDTWRRFRTLLSPTFSGAKLKQMNAQINQCARILVKNLGEYADSGDGIDLTKFCGAFSMDVIARTTFGLEIDSQNDLDNPFAIMSRKILQSLNPKNPALWAGLLPFLVPIFKALDVTIFPKDAVAFFVDIVNRAIDQRNEMKVKQLDFLQLMLNAEKELEESKEGQTDDDMHGVHDGAPPGARKSNVKGLNRDEILGNAFIFFLAGHETTASALSYLLYNLALFPECQEQLLQEVHNAFGDKEDVDYVSLNSLSYMEQCINESLRMYPPIKRTTRISRRNVTIAGVTIQKSVAVAAAIYAMHHDPDIYPEPDKFKPERFSAEGKAQRSPYHFMPFGYGPRNCIGLRLAYMELKMALTHLIRHFRFTTCDKTEIPLTFRKDHLLATKNGIWLSIERR